MVANEAEFAKKLTQLANPFVDVDGKVLPLAEVGKKLVDLYNCRSCHTVDGKVNTGPTWHNLYKSTVKFSQSDEAGYTLSESDSDAKWLAYFDQSIINPSAKIVEGFQNSMTPFGASLSGADPNDMKDDKNRRRRAIIEYIKSLDENAGGKPKYYVPAPLPVLESATQPATTQAGK